MMCESSRTSHEDNAAQHNESVGALLGLDIAIAALGLQSVTLGGTA
jgi:hypothetical protein